MPMRSLFYIIIGLVLVGCSCSGTSDVRDLDNAERLLLEDPAAAMAKLNEYDVSCFNDSSIMARWALLYSEALVANRSENTAVTPRPRQRSCFRPLPSERERVHAL